MRLNSAIGYITPKDMLAGRQQEIHRFIAEPLFHGLKWLHGYIHHQFAALPAAYFELQDDFEERDRKLEAAREQRKNLRQRVA